LLKDIQTVKVELVVVLVAVLLVVQVNQVLQDPIRHMVE